MAPERLADLRVRLVAGSRLQGALSGICTLVEEDADLLLVEACAAGDVEHGDEPSAIWLTREEDVRGFPVEALERYDHVFVTDASALKALAPRTGARRLLVLPLAACLPDPDPAERNGIAWAGGFSPAWPERSREIARALLGAARPHGLRILPDEADLEHLPRRFHEYVAGEEGPPPRAVIAFVPERALPTVPAAAFDAIAAGVPVIMRFSDAWQILPAGIVQYVNTPEMAREAVAWCLQDGEEQRQAIEESRAAVLNAHTYSARLATIASALGLALLPDPA